MPKDKAGEDTGEYYYLGPDDYFGTDAADMKPAGREYTHSLTDAQVVSVVKRQRGILEGVDGGETVTPAGVREEEQAAHAAALLEASTQAAQDANDAK